MNKQIEALIKSCTKTEMRESLLKETEIETLEDLVNVLDSNWADEFWSAYVVRIWRHCQEEEKELDPAVCNLVALHMAIDVQQWGNLSSMGMYTCNWGA